jgi:hypothetical protein
MVFSLALNYEIYGGMEFRARCSMFPVAQPPFDSAQGSVTSLWHRPSRWLSVAVGFAFP